MVVVLIILIKVARGKGELGVAGIKVQGPDYVKN